MDKYIKRYPLMKIDSKTISEIQRFMILWNSKLENITIKGESSDFIMFILISYYSFDQNLIPYIKHIENKLAQIKFDFSYGTNPEIIINHNPIFFSRPIVRSKTFFINKALLSKLYYWYIDIWPLRTCGAYYLPSYNILNIKNRFSLAAEGTPKNYTSVEQMLLHLNGIDKNCEDYLVRDTLIYNDSTLLDECIYPIFTAERMLILQNHFGSVYLTNLKNVKSQIFFGSGICSDLPQDALFLRDGNKRIIFYLTSEVYLNNQFINNGLFLGILRMYAQGQIRYPDSIIANSTSTQSASQLYFSDQDADLYTSYKMSPTSQTLGQAINTRSFFLSFAVEKWYVNKSFPRDKEYPKGQPFPLLQNFVDLYWQECKNLIDKKELFTILNDNAPKIFKCSTSDFKGYYDFNNHTIFLSDKYHDFDKLSTEILNKRPPSILFSKNLPIPTLIHELLHSLGCYSHGSTNILGVNLFFDDCANQIYKKMDILPKYFSLF